MQRSLCINVFLFSCESVGSWFFIFQLRFSKRQFVQKVQRAVDIVRSEGQRIFTNHDKEKEDHHDNILHHIIKYTGSTPREFVCILKIDLNSPPRI